VSVLFALLSALCYGTSDFIGGVVSTKIPAWTSAFCSQLGGMAATIVISVATTSHLTGGSLAWGALSGVCTGLGMVALYHGLAIGRMGVVAPITGIVGAIVPALVGVIDGDRPGGIVWTGLVLALPAVFLVAAAPPSPAVATSAAGAEDPAGPSSGSSPVPTSDSGALFGLLAGVGFGFGFATIAQVPESAGHWPVVLSMAVGALFTALIATFLGEAWRPTRRSDWWASAGGLLGGTAVIFFLAAANSGMLSVAAVLSSLYPAVTVLLAVAILREHVHKIQALGLGLTGVAVALVALG
jgi:uncharacterized membrane protein